MDSLVPSFSLYRIEKSNRTLINSTSNFKTHIRAHSKNLRFHRRPKLPKDLEVNIFLKKKNIEDTLSPVIETAETSDDTVDSDEGDVVWESDEIEAISSLFKGRIPQKPGNLTRVRPLPLPIPHKIRPIGLPTTKYYNRTVLDSTALPNSRQSLTKLLYKNPSFLIGLAKEIKILPPDKDASVVLKKWVQFLRKGSLSLTVRELGHMGMPERALQVYTWVQKQPLLFPDDRILAATVEVLASAHELKIPFHRDNFVKLASRTVNEAMIKGFIKGGSLKLALKLIRVAKNSDRLLGPAVYAKLILELSKNPDRYDIVSSLLQDLAERDDLNLSHQDCTSIMKVCVKLCKFEMVEILFNWFKKSKRDPSVVMYTTVIHSRYSSGNYREALALVWEIEGSNCALDFPAYRVLIKLFVALNDVSRAGRYFAKLKEAGFLPTFDIYRDLVKVYVVCGRLAKCKQVCKEAELAGFKFDQQITAR